MRTEPRSASAGTLWALARRAGLGWIGVAVASGLLRAGALVLQASALAQVAAAAMRHRLDAGLLGTAAWELGVAALVVASAALASELAGERSARRARASLRREGLAAASTLLATQRSPHLEADDGGLGALSTALTAGVDGIDAFVGRYLPQPCSRWRCRSASWRGSRTWTCSRPGSPRSRSSPCPCSPRSPGSGRRAPSGHAWPRSSGSAIASSVSSAGSRSSSPTDEPRPTRPWSRTPPDAPASRPWRRSGSPSSPGWCSRCSLRSGPRLSPCRSGSALTPASASCPRRSPS